MVLDKIENIILNEHEEYFHNYQSVVHLILGIKMLYKGLIRLEANELKKYAEMFGDDVDINNFEGAVVSFGSNHFLNSTVINYFNWYSINLINYANFCGFIKFINEKRISPFEIEKNKKIITDLKSFRKEYLLGIKELKEVIHFRNKASAHFAYSDPKESDNIATLIESISILPTFVGRRFKLSGFQRGLPGSMSSFSENIWSMTENYESLKFRFFENDIPDVTFLIKS